MKKGIFLFIVALLVYLPLYGYDQYVNDFKKDEKGLIAMERYAAPQFKPSTMRDNLSSTYPGLRLKEKGISLQELLIQIVRTGAICLSRVFSVFMVIWIWFPVRVIIWL